MSMCEFLASWSEERGRKVGAVIVGSGNTVVSSGYNGLPRGVLSHFENRHDRSSGEKYYWFEHAERNAIYNAARLGIGIEGCRIYTNLFPCADCTRAIIQSGIVRIITRTPPENDPIFRDSMNISMKMLGEAGVEVVLY